MEPQGIVPNPKQDAEVMQMLELVGRRGFTYTWQMLRNHDDALDADAVISVRMTTSMIGQGMAEILTYGTAVQVDKVE